MKGRGLKVFENRVLRIISGLKMNKMVRGWRKLHNEELHNLWSPPNTICEQVKEC
jgi:hypothetical protein